MSHFIIPIFITHQGCPHTCVFCNQARIAGVDEASGAALGGADVHRIAREHLATLPAGERTVELSFFGGTFTAIPVAQQIDLLGAARELLDAGLIQHIRCSTRPDAVDETVLERCRAFGMDIMELGVQSLDDEILCRSGRGHTAEDVRRASRRIKAFGLSLGHQIMPGLPGADPGRDLATARQSIAMAPDQVRIYPTLVIRDTPLASLYAAGDYQPYDLDTALALTGQIMALYEEAGIPIIRVGLQGTAEIAPAGDLIAGPWHPSFRELVLGRRFHERLGEALAGASSAQLTVNPRDLSVVYADAKRWFRQIRPQPAVRQDPQLPRGQARLNRNDSEVTLCI